MTFQESTSHRREERLPGPRLNISPNAVDNPACVMNYYVLFCTSRKTGKVFAFLALTMAIHYATHMSSIYGKADGKTARGAGLHSECR